MGFNSRFRGLTARSTAFPGTNWYDDNNKHLLVVAVIPRVACTGLIVTCMVLEGGVSRFPGFWMPLIPTSENSLDKGSAVPTGEEEKTEVTQRYVYGRNNNERRAQANVRANTP